MSWLLGSEIVIDKKDRAELLALVALQGLGSAFASAGFLREQWPLALFGLLVTYVAGCRFMMLIGEAQKFMQFMKNVLELMPGLSSLPGDLPRTRLSPAQELVALLAMLSTACVWLCFIPGFTKWYGAIPIAIGFVLTAIFAIDMWSTSVDGSAESDSSA